MFARRGGMVTECWRQMSVEKAHEIIQTVHETNKKLYRKTLELLAPHMGKRAAIILEMPKKERHQVWIEFFKQERFATFAFNFLSWWLMERHRPMLSAWLTHLGIEHESGIATEFPDGQPAAEVLAEGVEKLLRDFDAEDVKIYLRAFYEIDEVHWPNLATLLESEPRLAWSSEKSAVGNAKEG
ncbi:MAG: hypothetical protein RML49_05360 [Verrucomicrobiae bacterium]|nr:hypothetical protein [Verrucomicrobiae bacterium]